MPPPAPSPTSETRRFQFIGPRPAAPTYNPAAPTIYPSRTYLLTPRVHDLEDDAPSYAVSSVLGSFFLSSAPFAARAVSTNPCSACFRIFASSLHRSVFRVRALGGYVNQKGGGRLPVVRYDKVRRQETQFFEWGLHAGTASARSALYVPYRFCEREPPMAGCAHGQKGTDAKAKPGCSGLSLCMCYRALRPPCIAYVRSAGQRDWGAGGSKPWGENAPGKRGSRVSIIA